MYKHDNTLVLAHYYTTQKVQELADFVGDSLDLALKAHSEKPKRIVFAGVKFMAETVKILNPDTEVILPDPASTCSLVTQTNMKDLNKWVNDYKNKDYEHVSYINSSAEHKAISDLIVTSRNVDDIIKDIYETGNKVIFSPDRNMGNYLNYTYNFGMPIWNAVCEVHDRFNENKMIELMLATDDVIYLIAHPETPLPILKRANFIGSTSELLNWVKNFTTGGVVYVATEEGLLHNMRSDRPDLDIRQAPIYSGCQCNSCPYMKYNSIKNITDSINIGTGLKIDYLSDGIIEKAKKPIIKMMEFNSN